MNQLNKYRLDFDLAYQYVKEDLDKTNTLSAELLNLLDFKNGCFFTLLPDDANIQSAYNFRAGGILSPSPIQEYFLNGHKSAYSIKTSIRSELSKLIEKEFRLRHFLTCICDDVSCSPVTSTGYYFFDNYGLSYQNEVYYYLENSQISDELLMELLRVSNSIWHSLCVFTKANFNKNIKLLSLEKIREICLTTELLMIGAYDAEGYVFWEKNLTITSKGFF